MFDRVESGMSSSVAVQTIRFGITMGLAASVIYPVMLFAPLPDILTVLLAALFGPCLIAGSWGLRAFMVLDRRTVWTNLAMIFNALAGAMFTAMLLVQLAVRMGNPDQAQVASLVPIWLGLDVAWDVYIGLGTMLFGIAAISHARLGRTIGVFGVLLGIVLLYLNLWTFPTPPAEAGSLDIGPFVGLWYLAMTLMVLRSLKWAREAAN